MTCDCCRLTVEALESRVALTKSAWPAPWLHDLQDRAAARARTNQWAASLNGTVLEIAYGSGTNYPQYAAFHLESSYFRMNYGNGSGWGTSIVVAPSFWSGGTYYQGAALQATWGPVGADFQVNYTGTIGGLNFTGRVRLKPPNFNLIRAQVQMQTLNSVGVDYRPGEAFKPAMLSSMHISETQWDTNGAFVGPRQYPIPPSGFIVSPFARNYIFGLNGGDSAWKTNAPTVHIRFNRLGTCTGYVTPSGDPNDDNIGFWNAFEAVLKHWSYVITVREA